MQKKDSRLIYECKGAGKSLRDVCCRKKLNDQNGLLLVWLSIKNDLMICIENSMEKEL